MNQKIINLKVKVYGLIMLKTVKNKQLNFKK